MKRDLTIKEYVGWRLYYGKEPFGPLMEDLQHAHTRLTIAQVSAKPKGGGSFKLDSFRLMAESREGEVIQSPEEMKEQLMNLAQYQEARTSGR